MPMTHAFRPCAIYSGTRNSIFILGRPAKSEDDNEFYEFSPEERTFTELPDMPGKAIAMDCAMDESLIANDETDEAYFTATGGYW